jgi:pseudouridine synthase
MPSIRLNKFLSQAGAASRRLADELIAQGRVEVNGRVVTELGAKADPGIDDVRVDGRRLKVENDRRYILLNKPRGVLSTRSDPRQRRTVIDLLAESGVRGYFYPVGRLDHDSEGLILLANDGEFANRVTHPRYELERTYEALVEGVPDERDLQRLRTGIEIEGRRTLPAAVRLVRTMDGRNGVQAVVELTLREGRNRQVRRMCDAIAHPVDRLRRVRIGQISDRALRLGQMRDLTPAEVRSLTGGGAGGGDAAPRTPRQDDRPRSPRRDDRSRPPRRDSRESAREPRRESGHGPRRESGKESRRGSGPDSRRDSTRGSRNERPRGPARDTRRDSGRDAPRDQRRESDRGARPSGRRDSKRPPPRGRRSR